MGELDGVWPYFGEKITNLVAWAGQNAAWPPCAAFMGLRTFEQQDDLYALGRTKKNTDGVRPDRPMGITVTNARGGESWHNYGLAADVVFKPGGTWSWDYKTLPYNGLGNLGVDLELEWGGYWPAPKTDQPHFQLKRGLLLERAKVIYADGGLEAVWEEVAKRIATGAQ